VLQLKDLWGRSIDDKVAGDAPSPPVILQRYDKTEFKWWGSANDMIPWELRGSGQGIEIWPGRELDSDRVGTSPIKPRQGGRRGLVAANTRNDSVELTSCQVIS